MADKNREFVLIGAGSTKAQEKIESAGGECVSIDDIMESNPKGSNIRIME